MGFVSIRKMWVDEVGWMMGWGGWGFESLRFPLTPDTLHRRGKMFSVESSLLLSFLLRSLSLSASSVVSLSGRVDPLSPQGDW